MDQQTVGDVLTYIGNHWPSILNYSIDGFSIAIALQWLAHRFKLDQARIKLLGFIKLDGPKIATLILTVGTTVATTVDWLLDQQNAAYIPHEFAFILTAAIYIHRFLVDPTVVKLAAWLRPYLKAIQLVNASYGPTQQPPVPGLTTPQLQPVYVPVAPAQPMPTAPASPASSSQAPGPAAPPSNP